MPLLIGNSLGTSREQVARLISADLFRCGILTMIRCLGVWKFSARLPIMMGISLTAVPVIIATGQNPDLSIRGVFGAAIGSGIFTIFAAWLLSKWVRLFPAVVTGTCMLVIGVSLMRAGVNWAAGGDPTIRAAQSMVADPAYGHPFAINVTGVVPVIILLLTRVLSWLLRQPWRADRHHHGLCDRLCRRPGQLSGPR